MRSALPAVLVLGGFTDGLMASAASTAQQPQPSLSVAPSLSLAPLSVPAAAAAAAAAAHCPSLACTLPAAAVVDADEEGGSRPPALKVRFGGLATPGSTEARLRGW